MTPAPAAGAAVDLVVPGSAANLGPGFDSVGLALGFHDRYRAVVTDEPGLVLDLGEDSQGVPQDDTHLVVATLYRAWDELGVERPAGLHLTCRNTIRMGRGMGSSAAAIVAGVALADALRRPEAVDASEDAQVPLDLAFVNDLSAVLEGHPDNSSASVFGGATLSVSDEAVDGVAGLPRTTTVQLDLHPDLEPVVFVPDTQLATSKARAALPSVVPHAEAALNSARVGLLVHALTRAPQMLLPATREWLHQEQRRPAYPESMALVDDLRSQGHAAVVSGAGPSVVVLSTREVAPTVAPRIPTRWQAVRPGIPSEGVTVTRATLIASR